MEERESEKRRGKARVRKVGKITIGVSFIPCVHRYRDLVSLPRILRSLPLRHRSIWKTLEDLGTRESTGVAVGTFRRDTEGFRSYVRVHTGKIEFVESALSTLGGDSPRTVVQMEIYEPNTGINRAPYRAAFRAIGRCVPATRNRR